MRKLHIVQKQLLDLLEEHLTDPLTMRELQKKTGISSTSVVHHHINQLEKKGYLRRNPANTRDYEVFPDNPEKKIAYIDLYEVYI